MGASAKTLLRRVAQKGTWGDVGSVGQNLMAEILGCEQSPRGQPEFADIMSRELKLRSEVKTRASHLPLGIRISQLTDYQSWDSLPDGIHDTLYALISYNARENKPRRRGEDEPIRKSLLSRARGDLNRQRLVLDRLTSAYLFDIEVIEALRENCPEDCPTEKGVFSGENRRDDPTLKLSREFLKLWTHRIGFREMSSKFGINPSNFVRSRVTLGVSVPVGIGYTTVSMDLVILVRRSTFRRIQPVLAQKTLTLV